MFDHDRTSTLYEATESGVDQTKAPEPEQLIFRTRSKAFILAYMEVLGWYPKTIRIFEETLQAGNVVPVGKYRFTVGAE